MTYNSYTIATSTVRKLGHSVAGIAGLLSKHVSHATVTTSDIYYWQIHIYIYNNSIGVFSGHRRTLRHMHYTEIHVDWSSLRRISTWMCTHADTHTHLLLHVCIYIYICMYMYMYMYIHTIHIIHVFKHTLKIDKSCDVYCRFPSFCLVQT